MPDSSRPRVYVDPDVELRLTTHTVKPLVKLTWRLRFKLWRQKRRIRRMSQPAQDIIAEFDYVMDAAFLNGWGNHPPLHSHEREETNDGTAKP